MIPIVDLHCDLPSYLVEDSKRTPYDRESLCSIYQLIEGGVKLQVMALYTETGNNAVCSFQRQIEIFRRLTALPECTPYEKNWQESKKLTLLPSIENASGLALEEEPLDKAFERFDAFCQQIGTPLYLSFTWHHENRFGGGNISKEGLKPDGERLLEYLSGKKCAIDLSHASDSLAGGILDTIHKKNLKITPIASHSNFREVVDQARNLPDEFAKEIFSMGGVIGLNLVRDFIGHQLPEHLYEQVNRAKELGGINAYCLGTDFFYTDKSIEGIPIEREVFHQELGNASCHPYLLSILSAVLSPEEKEKVAYKNFIEYVEREES